jgi:hypothetical protein
MAACKSTTDRNTPERSSSGDERMPRAPRRQTRRRRTIGQRADASAKPERMPGVTDGVICSAGASDCRRAWSSTRKHSRTLRISARPPPERSPKWSRAPKSFSNGGASQISPWRHSSRTCCPSDTPSPTLSAAHNASCSTAAEEALSEARPEASIACARGTCVEGRDWAHSMKSKL